MWDINVALFQWMNQLGNIPLIGKIAPIMADAPIFFLPIFLVFMWLRAVYKKENSEIKINLLHIFYSPVIAIGISLIIQQFIHLERPETAISGSGRLLLDHIPDASFPSDHASVSLAFLTALYLTGYKKTFWCFLPFVVIMNLSRIIAGVHWPIDTCAGIVVGILSAFISCRYLRHTPLFKKINNFILHTLSYVKL